MKWNKYICERASTQVSPVPGLHSYVLQGYTHASFLSVLTLLNIVVAGKPRQPLQQQNCMVTNTTITADIGSMDGSGGGRWKRENGLVIESRSSLESRHTSRR